ncbi:MAG TPA: N-formylglutamate amidohydrolase [Albidovulum sp.]|uniref:N-formylglutamate amidohydrolase n=1 Tax=Albidovulum sp. TaxID=1872424 RepID=UPI002C01C873|nr:N-formylglutamate amidohydrolase [Albidovulum sp.]
MSTGRTGSRSAVVHIENGNAPGPFLVVCEHASNHIPPAYGALGLDAAARKAHIAWDPGALGVARRLAQNLDAPLIHAGISRLVYDLNRPPSSAGAMTRKSESFVVPGNQTLTREERQKRTNEIYLPFHDAVHAEIARRMALGTPPVLVTIHSFTPVWFGKPRAAEFGIIHDADPTLAKAVLAEAKARTGLDCRLNEPYSAADEVTHTLRLHATPYGLKSVMLEVRNDLIADPVAEAAMADGLTPVLSAALRACAPEVAA